MAIVEDFADAIVASAAEIDGRLLDRARAARLARTTGPAGRSEWALGLKDERLASDRLIRMLEIRVTVKILPEPRKKYARTH